MLNCTFDMSASCEVENIDFKLSSEEMIKELEKMLYIEAGIVATIKIDNLTYNDV